MVVAVLGMLLWEEEELVLWEVVEYCWSLEGGGSCLCVVLCSWPLLSCCVTLYPVDPTSWHCVLL